MVYGLWFMDFEKMENQNEIFNYNKLVAYQRAKEMVKEVYGLLKKFPREEQYALCDQLRRASTSVTSNIAEGKRYPDKIHFLEIAYGSLMEVHSQMDVACDLGYILNEELSHLEGTIVSVIKPLSGLRSSYLEKVRNPQVSINH